MKERATGVAFEGSNATAYSKLIGGIVLFIFMLIMTPLLAEKYIIDFTFILEVGGAIVFSVIMAYTGYYSMNPIVLYIDKQGFAFQTNNIQTDIDFDEISSITKHSSTKKLNIEYSRDGKNNKYIFNTMFLKEEVREKALKLLIAEYGAYKKN